MDPMRIAEIKTHLAELAEEYTMLQAKYMRMGDQYLAGECAGKAKAYRSMACLFERELATAAVNN